MPKSRGRRPGKPGSRTSGRPAAPPQRREAREPGLLEQVAAATADDHPLGLLSLASAMLNALDPRTDNPFGRRDAEELPPLAPLLDSFLHSGEHEAVILAWTMAHIANDEMVRARTVRSVGEYAEGFPSWMRELDALKFVGAEQGGDDLRDCVDVVVSARLADHDLMAVTLIDFNLGTIIKDGFFTDQTLPVFRELWQAQRQVGMGPLQTIRLADARARIEDAVETGARTWPPAESNSWPAARPLLGWLVRQLPAGETGLERPDWPEAEQDRLAERFLASAYAVDLGRPDDRSIVGDLVWYRTGYGYGDPLRWSATACEILLLDWYPRKIVADQDYLQRMPTVLGQFIRFAHAEAGIDAILTEETLAGLTAFTSGYLEAIGRPRRQGPEALLERMGALAPLSIDGDDPIDFADLERFQRSMLAEMVGGEPQLGRLTAEPLPDEPFDDQGIPDQIAARVAETLALTDRSCTELLDTEHRTAVRRLLHDVAIADPRGFDGRSKPRTAAAGLCWMVGRANETVGHPGTVQTQELTAWFGLKAAPVTRADSIRRALGLDPLSWPASLGSPRYLTGERRAAIIAARDGDG